METESMGVLVGWTHAEFNGRVNLRLQSIHSSRNQSHEDVDSHYFMMTRNQAVVLANYLFNLTGQEPPETRRRGFFGRFFGH
jgi:hypothetical protein